MRAKFRSHDGTSGSTTSTSVSGVSPMFATSKEKVAESPRTTDWASGDLRRRIWGATTSTDASSLSECGLPIGSTAVTVATLVRSPLTMVVQMCWSLSPTASEPTVKSQSGTSGSDTSTSTRSVSPLLVTVSVNVAVAPFSSVWRSGVFWISMAGTRTPTINGSLVAHLEAERILARDRHEFVHIDGEIDELAGDGDRPAGSQGRGDGVGAGEARRNDEADVGREACRRSW